MFTKGLDRPHANDNAGPGEQRPAVTVPAGRPEQAYAQQGNLILPLRFARLLAGWAAPPAAARRRGFGDWRPARGRRAPVSR